MTEWDVVIQITKEEIFNIAKPIINRKEKRCKQYLNVCQGIYMSRVGKNRITEECKH